MNSLAYGLGTTLAGVLRLDGGVFVASVGARHGVMVAIAIVLAAGLSQALGQSIVLFANRVRPARFVFSLLVGAILFAFGYAFLVVSTWAVCRLPGAPHIAFETLALVFALSYAPVLLAFLGGLPYLGSGLMLVLRTWHLLAMIVGVAAVGAIDVLAAAAYVGLGWIVMVLAQRSFGRPVTNLGTRLLDAVAGVSVVDDETLVIGRSEDGMDAAPRATAPVAVLPAAAQHPNRWLALVGLGGVALFAVVVAVALEPVRRAIFGWEDRLPVVLQLPVNLAWLAVIALVVSAFMAPLETLGWWAGWFGDRIDTSGEDDAADAAPAAAVVSRYIVYLDGIAQSSSRYTSDIETFLDALVPELPAGVRLVRGVMAYSVVNRPLDDDPLFSRFWQFVDALRLKRSQSLLGMIVNLRNVLIVAVSADPRFGPMYNFGIATVMYKALVANGYRRNSGIPVTLIGYSGGGQMACGAATFLKRALGAPIDVISLGGVISGNDPILDLEHLYHLVGTKDNVERIGPVMFASRWSVAAFSFWNRAKRLGTLTEISLGPVGHQVPGGMLDPNARLPDGRTNLRQTLDFIANILAGRLVTFNSGLVKRPSNYARYIEAPWNQPAFYPVGAAVPPGYVAAADWIGRLILPALEQRFAGAWLEVHHAPAAYAHLTGTTVKLCWAEDSVVDEMRRAVVRDVSFSAEAEYSSAYGGCIHPVRLNHWRMVDPLESLAGARPVDDVVVSLAGRVDVDESAPTGSTLRIAREPVQISGRYRGLVTFLGPAAGTLDGFRVRHFDSGTQAFSGAEEIVRLPAVVPDLEGVTNSSTAMLEHSPLNAEGWYVYGAPDATGAFVVQSLAPRSLFRIAPDRDIAGSRAAYRYVRKDAWKDIDTSRGAAIAVRMTPDVNDSASGEVAWKAGDTGLLMHTYGGIGGKMRERASSGPVYFGHFAYGVAEVVEDPLAGELRFDITYHQVYTHNTDGIVAGALHWSRYMGDRQFGWSGVRPVCDLILRHDGFDGNFEIDGERRSSALDALVRQLAAMTARYRIGDGTGGTFVGIANNCAQDANHALFATLRQLQAFVENHPAFDAWIATSPGQSQRYGALTKLAGDLRKQLQPLGTPRRDWSENQYNLGTTMQDAPITNLVEALASWRCIFPRMAFDAIAHAFLTHGASGTLLATSQIGGFRPEIAPVEPSAF
jgi:predicted Abi (CAAX) family protease